MDAQERNERIRVLENALSLLSGDATEADKALVKGELQALTEERDKDIAEANARIRYIQEQIDLVKPLDAILGYADETTLSVYGDQRYSKDQKATLDFLKSLTGRYKFDKQQVINRIQRGLEGQA